MYEKQMELFEDGGLRDEGGMVDEVSGNDVPVGSTRKEVRDDIPAMLSEGEFVFPADVVRYIGLENLMRIRQDAKQGLKQMEAMGQMGNGDEAVIPDDMPFGVMDLIIVDGGEEEEPQEKAQGGVIHANQGTFVTPMFDPSDQDVREYKNDKGDSLFIPFLGGEPVYPVPTGYFPAGQAPEETETEQAIPVSDDSGPTTPPPQSEFQKAGGFGMDTSATDGKALATWIKEAEKAGTVGNVVAGIAATINPLIGGAIVLANKKQKKEIIAMLDEKIAQAKKTPIAGQVKALRDLKTRLTTDEGKGILSKVVSSIIEPIADALGFGEEEKTKAKAVAGTVAGQDPNESDAATEQAVKKSLRPELRPDGLPTTAENFRETEANLFDDRSNSIVEADDLEATDGPTTPEIPSVTELGRDLIKSEGGDFLRKNLGTPDYNHGMRFRDNRIDEPPNVAMPEEPTVSVPSLTAPTLPSRSDIELEVGPAKPANVTTAVDDLRQTIADISYDESRATAMSSLSGFGEDASSQAIKSYLEKAMNNVDTIVKGTDTPPTTEDITPPPPAPVQGGGDDDDGPSFPTVTQEQISQAQEQATSSAIESGATQEEAEKAGTVAGGQMAGKGYVGGYGFNKGGLASRKKKKK